MSTFKVGDKVVIDPMAYINVNGSQGDVNYAKFFSGFPHLTITGVNEYGNLTFAETAQDAMAKRFKLYGAAPAIVEVAEEPRQDYIIVDCEGDYYQTLRGVTLAEAKAHLVEDKGESSYWPFSLFTKAVTLNLTKNIVEV